MADHTSEVQNKIKDLKGMKRPELQDQLNDYMEMIARLDRLDQKITDLFKKNRESYPEITENVKNELFRLYQSAGASIERFCIKCEKEQKYAPILNEVRELQIMMNRDSSVLLDYKPDQEICSLPQLLERSRTYVMDLGNTNLKKVGGNTSSRIPVSYTGEDGVNHTGVFTEKKISDPTKEFNEFLEKLNQANKEYQFGKIFDAYLHNWIEKDNAAHSNSAKINPDDAEGKIFFSEHYREKKEVKAGDIFAFARDQYEDSKKLPENRRICQEFANWPKRGTEKYKDFMQLLDQNLNAWKEYQKKYINKYAITVTNGRIVEKCRIDSRNTGMSRVAALLGVPNLLAHSEPMKIKYQDKEVDGTFMDLGDGMDLNYPTEASDTYHYYMFWGEGLKSIADLQVLDYICGNSDRHLGNMLYKFDTSDSNPRNHKFLGVQGIDNDLSFGNYATQRVEGHLYNMNSIQSMRVISESMANAVSSLSLGAFRFQLRDLGLTEKQLDCAMFRLKFLQDHIALAKENGKTPLRIVPDKAFANMTAEELAYKGNQFKMLEDFHAMRNLNNVGKSMQIQEVNRDTGWFMPHGETRQVEQLYQKMKDATVNNKSSDQYKELMTSLAKYWELTRTMGYTSLAWKQKQQRTKCMEEIKQKAIAYLGHKSRNDAFSATNVADAEKAAKGVMHMDYATSRINLVAEIGKWAETRVNCWNRAIDPESDEYRQIMEVCHKREENEVARLNMEMRKLATEIYNKQKPKQQQKEQQQKEQQQKEQQQKEQQQESMKEKENQEINLPMA